MLGILQYAPSVTDQRAADARKHTAVVVVVVAGVAVIVAVVVVVVVVAVVDEQYKEQLQ